MLNLSYQVVEFECPECGFVNEALLKQAMAEETIICRGCLVEIHLVDDGGSTRRAEREINQAMRDLQNTIGRMGI